MALAAQFVRNDRRADRETLDVAGTLRPIPTMPIDVVVEDLSTTGFRMRTRTALKLAEKITIGIPGIGQRAAYVVRRTADGFGCEFTEAVDVRLVGKAASVEPLVEANFAGSVHPAIIREWSRANPPQVKPFARASRLLIVGGLGLAGWMMVLGIASLF